MKVAARSACVAIALLGATPRIAGAGDAKSSPEVLQRADAAFSEGKAAYARKDFAAAAAAFERANQVSAHGRTSFLAGLSWQEAGDAAQACDAFERSLAQGGLRDGQADDAKKRLSVLAAKVGRARLYAEKSARGAVDARPEAALPLALCLLPGTHEARAIFEDGSEMKQVFEVTAGAVTEVELRAPPPPGEPVVEAPPPVLAEKPKREPVAAPPAPRAIERDKESPRLPYYVAGGIAFGLSAASIGAMAGLGSYTMSLREEFIAGGQRDRSQHDAAVTARTLTNVTLGFGCAFAATGVILFAVAPREPDGAAKGTVSVRVVPGGASALLSY